MLFQTRMLFFFCGTKKGIFEGSSLSNAGLFQPKFGSNMDKPKCWVKNVI